MRIVACLAVVLLLMIAAPAPADVLVNQAHHYRIQTPVGWHLEPSVDGEDYRLRLNGSISGLPVIKVAFADHVTPYDLATIENTIRADLLKMAAADHTNLVIDRSDYDRLRSRVVVDYHTNEFGSVAQRCTLVCDIGEHIIVVCALYSRPLTYPINRPSLFELADTVRIDADYQVKTSLNTQPSPAPVVHRELQPAPQRQVRPVPQRQESQPEPASPSPRPMAMLPLWIFGGALVAFMGGILLLLAVVLAIVLVTRRRPAPAVAT
jgi:hypothetical protein